MRHFYSYGYGFVSVSVSHPPAARACMRLPQSKEGARPDDDLSPPLPTSEAANQ
jgi:hypothetical protein